MKIKNKQSLNFVEVIICGFLASVLVTCRTSEREVAAQSPLSIGWAFRDVSPDRPVVLYGQFNVRISKGVKDPITVTALAIEATGKENVSDKAIMISCDLCSAPPPILERIRRRFHERVPDFDVRKMFMNATHTHAAPMPVEGQYPPQGPEVMTATEYADFFVERATEAAVEAWTNRKPGGISWAFSHAVVSYSRLMRYSNPDFLQMYGNTNDPRFDYMEGYADHDVNLLYTYDEKDRLTGVIINIASPAQVDDNVDSVTADFWHDVRIKLHKKYGKSVFIFPQCSASGELSWQHPVNHRAEERMWKLKGINSRQSIAVSIANSVEDGLEATRKDIQHKVPFCHRVENIDLPVQRVTKEEEMYAMNVYEHFAAEYAKSPKASGDENYTTMNYHKAVVNRYNRQDTNPNATIEVHVLRLGDVVIATNPFEMFAEYGQRIKARSKALQTFVVQLAGADPGLEDTFEKFGCENYLPTERARRGGMLGKSYSVTVLSNPFGPDAGRILVERTLQMIDTAWSDK